jgi:dolichol-phosphate mannosyltransferase
MPSPFKTLVTVATYNEIDNLPQLVAAIHDHVPAADILVIDDNSPDGTGQWCDETHARDPRVSCLHRPAKLGLGTALIAGMRYAIANEYDCLLNMDADFSHHPQYIPAILAAMDPAGQPQRDCVIGSRYVSGGGTQGWPLHRRMMSRLVNFYARVMLGLKTKDNSGAYRCYRVELLQKIEFDSIRSRGYSFQEEILWHLKRAGARFAEVPIVFADRERGQSKIHAGEALAALWILFRLGMKNWTGM